MAGFDLDWSQVKGNRQDIMNEWGRASRVLDELTILGLSQDRSRLYLVFWKDCDKRREMATWFADYLVTLSAEAPKFVWIATPLVPSSKTIEFEGPNWRD
jgi:hypothetical protein